MDKREVCHNPKRPISNYPNSLRLEKMSRRRGKDDKFVIVRHILL